mmetsp:Transcript_24338/g.76792  ORF Transcript_24338/g.76792 Transcript_24338/m.76792 type:complete len:210 (-) Transcript_24338:2132-2761(-)
MVVRSPSRCLSSYFSLFPCTTRGTSVTVGRLYIHGCLCATKTTMQAGSKRGLKGRKPRDSATWARRRTAGEAGGRGTQRAIDRRPAGALWGRLSAHGGLCPSSVSEVSSSSVSLLRPTSPPYSEKWMSFMSPIKETPWCSRWAPRCRGARSAAAPCPRGSRAGARRGPPRSPRRGSELWPPSVGVRSNCGRGVPRRLGQRCAARPPPGP